MELRFRSGFVLGAVLAAACGGGAPQAKAPEPQQEEDEHGHSGSPLDVSSEIGALDENQVTKIFTQSVKDFQACLDAGAKRVEFIGGSVGFFVKVDAQGHVAHAHLEQSTLGDRETEKCMLQAISKRDWPAPQGGKTGLARKSFDFDPPNDVRPPTDWDAERATSALSKKSGAIQKCKADAPGTYAATMYVNTNGSVISIGMAPPDEHGEAAVDCLVDVVKHEKFPSPGSWPAKVSFEL